MATIQVPPLQYQRPTSLTPAIVTHCAALLTSIDYSVFNPSFNNPGCCTTNIYSIVYSVVRSLNALASTFIHCAGVKVFSSTVGCFPCPPLQCMTTVIASYRGAQTKCILNPRPPLMHLTPYSSSTLDSMSNIKVLDLCCSIVYYSVVVQCRQCCVITSYKLLIVV